MHEQLDRIERKLNFVLRLQGLVLRLQDLTLEEIDELADDHGDETLFQALIAKLRKPTEALKAELAKAKQG